jgi:hypothetical protein
MAAQWGKEMREEKEQREKEKSQYLGMVRVLERRWQEEKEKGDRREEEVRRLRSQCQEQERTIAALQLKVKAMEDDDSVDGMLSTVSALKTQLTALRQPGRQGEEQTNRRKEEEGDEEEKGERVERESTAWVQPRRVVYRHGGSELTAQPASHEQFHRSTFYHHYDVNEWARRA